MKTLCPALVLTVIITALLPEVTAFFEGQRPVFPPGVKPPSPGDVGDPCTTGFDCKNGTCCVQSSDKDSRTCENLGRFGQVCSEDPIKGGIYTDHCPCKPGDRCVPFCARI
ncbi:secreted protein, putative [Ixodes scapularis]|uniref:Secreted protein, putative n=1 Tax=Ixodes scapularis TaxID=6945 RepID=B7P9I7_IXOSC|nr:secreted protein, putative [Ixodes scapularis]|eukprot:XP_002404511.1 secreted protein, putative [Ixodes scapularis]